VVSDAYEAKVMKTENQLRYGDKDGHERLSEIRNLCYRKLVSNRWDGQLEQLNCTTKANSEMLFKLINILSEKGILNAMDLVEMLVDDADDEFEPSIEFRDGVK